MRYAFAARRESAGFMRAPPGARQPGAAYLMPNVRAKRSNASCGYMADPLAPMAACANPGPCFASPPGL